MAGLGLMNRRRAIQSSPTVSEIDTSGYVQDSILMWLDGIEKGGEAGVWKDKKGVNDFVSVGAIELENGWEFDGVGYMECVGGTSYKVSNNRTIELVVEFFGSTATECVLATASGGWAFARNATRYIMGMGSDYTAFVNSLALNPGIVVFTKSMGANYLNGEVVSASSTAKVTGATSTLYLGNKADMSLPFKGIIHSIRLHDRTLTTEEVLRNQQLDNIRFKLGIEALNPTE